MYVPDLLPDNSKVELGEYKTQTSPAQSSKILSTLATVLAIMFFIGTLANLFTHFWQGLLYLIIGFTILPYGHKFIERKLKFKFTWLIKSSFIFILFFSSVFVARSYAESDKITAAKEKVEKERKAEEERITKLKVEKLRKAKLDSLNNFLGAAKAAIKHNKYSIALTNINSALLLADTNKSDIIYVRAQSYYKAGKYENALADFTSLVSSSYSLGNVYYERAQCYQKLSNKKEAVSDLKQSIELGNKSAEKLYNKINPLKKRITGYITRCCDGSTSYATGRGACSHHGGVCQWNEPVYEEYRDFD